jgi:hypothetical protein
MAAMSDARVTDERMKCLRIFADANGETHMEDVDIALQRKKLFEDNPPLRVCTENLIHVDGMRESPKLTRWLRFYGLCLRSWPRR